MPIGLIKNTVTQSQMVNYLRKPPIEEVNEKELEYREK